MQHRRTDSERRAPLRRHESARLVIAAAWLFALGWPVLRSLAAEEKAGSAGDAAVSADLERELRQRVRPLLDRFCLKCHLSEEPEADIDLQRFTSLAEARRGVSTWRRVAEVLDKGEMPPPEARQPKPDDRRALRGWVGRYLDFEAKQSAGDPGRVVMRRLSNVEYTRTVCDLTGVPLDPAREFPQDGAAGEGFTNTGDALVMSPALLGKYLDAAKEIAAHAVPLPDGFRFSRSAGRRDWTDEIVTDIRRLYDRFADKDGKIPLESYLAATIELRSRGAGRPVEPAEITRLATSRGLSPEYLGSLWAALNAGRSQMPSRPALEPPMGATGRSPGRQPRDDGPSTTSSLSAPPRPEAGPRPASGRGDGGAKGMNRRAGEPGADAPGYVLAPAPRADRIPPQPHTGGPLDDIRARWQAAGPGDVPALAGAIRQWQSALWRFNSVAYAFDGSWQVPVTALAGAQTLRRKLPESTSSGEIIFSLSVGDAGDGHHGDVIIWRRPRLERPGRPPLLLRDVRGLTRHLVARRREVLGATGRYLAAAAGAPAGSDRARIAALAKKHDVPADALAAWLDYLGLAGEAPARIDGYLTEKQTRAGGYEYVQAWRTGELPSLVANASDQEVRIPGLVKPHGICVHPSPSRSVAIGWRSPIAGRVRVAPTVADAHAGCGNGVAWSLELRRGGQRRRLAAGAFGDGQKASIAPIAGLDVQTGDLVSLVIGPRDGNHGCDTTEVALDIAESGSKARRWHLAPDVSGDLLAGNPHADRLGHPDVWHFYSEPVGDRSFQPVVPGGSMLARWLEASDPAEKARLAGEVQRLLTAPTPPAGKGQDSPDALLYHQALALDGPLFGPLAASWDPRTTGDPGQLDPARDWGLDPALFGKPVGGQPVDAESLGVAAPSSLEIRLPADLVAGREFVVTGELEPRAGAAGSVQLELTDRPPSRESLGRLRPGAPVVVRDVSRARARLEASFAEFRRMFPAGLCFRQIIPVDEVVTMIQFFRADEPFARLMLDDAGRARLDRLWDELHYVSQDGIKVYQTFDQMLGFASQEGQTAKVEAWRKPITSAYEAAVKVQAASEPQHIRALIAFAARAYRRPLDVREKVRLRELYGNLREEKLGHDDAFRLVLARILVSPDFLYRVERPGPGQEAQPVSDWELASRLSYFLWSSMPDDELTRLAAAGRLKDPDVLVAQARRMVRDEKARGLATEFACQWLEIRDFDTHDEKSERHFPTFAQIRPDLFEEAVRFFADLFARDGSILELLDADHTFLNESLAKHYGIPGVAGPEWRRVDGVRSLGRGGVLALGAILAKQSGASRTSPVLRGNWLLESLLGERLSKPPKNVPQLPDDEAATDGLTVRQLVEKHRSVASCAACHNRIDPFGFALEAYDPIGRLRHEDLGGRPVDTRAELKDGTRFVGIDGLKEYLKTRRREEFRRQFCRKLLGYALGRAVQLSDEPLIDEMLQKLGANDDRFSAAFETIVRSKPFRYHRGLAGEG